MLSFRLKTLSYKYVFHIVTKPRQTVSYSLDPPQIFHCRPYGVKVNGASRLIHSGYSHVHLGAFVQNINFK